MINLAIAGAGKVAALHARVIAQSRAARLVAVCDPLAGRAQTLAVAHDATVRPFDEILADPNITAVILATPSDLHLRQVRRCVEAGKHALAEFPLFGRPGELGQVFDLARQHGACVRVAHTTHYIQPYVQARRILSSGRLGQPHTALYRRRLYRPGGIAPDRNWRDNALTHLGGHALDLLPWLLDDTPQQIRTMAQPSAREATVVGLLLGMAGGSLGYISIDFESRPNAIELEVACSNGTLVVQGFSVLEVDGQVELQIQDDDEAYFTAITAQDEGFMAAIQGHGTGAGIDNSLQETLQLDEWMARALRSARTR